MPVDAGMVSKKEKDGGAIAALPSLLLSVFSGGKGRTEIQKKFTEKTKNRG